MLRVTENFHLPGLHLDMFCCSQTVWRGILSSCLEEKEEKPDLAAEKGGGGGMWCENEQE